MTSLRVLHIDDEPDIREVVALSLALDPELAVRGCASGGEGVLAAAEDTPDLILLDVMMPVMDGPTTLARLRENPRTAGIPIVFMTARAQDREIEQFKILGAAGVIAKPFDPLTLAASVRSHMRPAENSFEARLAGSRGLFLQRLSKDADTLLQCWTDLVKESTLPAILLRIKEVAHGLAGIGGIFGFPQISEAAANLEEAVIIQINGGREPRKIERALEQLLICIGVSIPGQPEKAVRRLDA